ncbi:MAG: hypothetical protein J5601_06760 [Elusimicrobiaceae bacterium]|nr:hypothetical protein [Elusimicrobiaceae bacterium]
MKTLVRILAGKISNKPCYVVTPITKYIRLTGEDKKHYLVQNPVIYEEPGGCCFSADLTEIGFADMSKSIANIGEAYRIPKEHVSTII